MRLKQVLHAFPGGWRYAFAAISDVANAQSVAVVAVGSDDICGIVTGPSGPEAGVWVISWRSGRMRLASGASRA